jgi:hypothetical protein
VSFSDDEIWRILAEHFLGILKLELDRPTYERCGLEGKPIEDGGRKHQKARYCTLSRAQHACQVLTQVSNRD